MKQTIVLPLLFALLLIHCQTQEEPGNSTGTEKTPGQPYAIPVIFDTDANNELDDQHALAYLLFNGNTFDVRGITVNATFNGGNIRQQYAEAERVLKLCSLAGEIPLYAGTNGSFEEIRPGIRQKNYDGKEAVDFIIAEARAVRSQPLLLLPVGKLTNIALALEKAPDIRDKVRIVWLGSNYPAPGEYNQENDIPALNYLLNQEVPFEIVTVRYGEPSGSDAVKVTPVEIGKNMAGAGPIVPPVTGRHGDQFTRFGDYSVSLFQNIDLYGDPPGRALFDMVAVAIVKNPAWGKKRDLPAPVLEDKNWKDRPDNHRRIVLWENFDKAAILADFFAVMQQPVLASRHFTDADSSMIYKDYSPQPGDRVVSRSRYLDQLYGFWLGECIANWTGLITEMDKIGNIGEIKTGAFYTREDWGKPDQQNIWGGGLNGNMSPVIDYFFEPEGSTWGADDDTDIEYIYQELLYANQTAILTGEQIREGWLNHIKAEEENYLWVSNQKAFDLMQTGMMPPATSAPENNPEAEMIDAQLTTEIFGLFAPSRPDVALKMAHLPIRATARDEAAEIAEFYVIMHSLASASDEKLPMKERTTWMADEARKHLTAASYPAKMYDFVKSRYQAGVPWEQTRDEIYQRYQVEQADGYDMTSKNIYCNACFAAGINFAASIVSLLYGEGDLKETIKIGALCGWDSDNPTATWGGLLGFMLGKEGVEKAFGRKFAEQFNIHRTRKGFPNNGIDNFRDMARKGMFIVDRAVQEQMGGGVDLERGLWVVPANAPTPPDSTRPY